MDFVGNNKLTWILVWATGFFVLDFALAIYKKFRGFELLAWVWNFLQAGICGFELVWLFGHEGVSNIYHQETQWSDPVTFSDTLKPHFWQSIWAEYAKEDPRYGNNSPFTIWAEGFNGISTLIPTLIILYFIWTHGRSSQRKPWPRWVYLMEVIMSYQMIYGLFLYIMTYLYEPIGPYSLPVRRLCYLVLTNICWVIFPSLCSWDAISRILEWKKKKSNKKSR